MKVGKYSVVWRGKRDGARVWSILLPGGSVIGLYFSKRAAVAAARDLVRVNLEEREGAI